MPRPRFRIRTMMMMVAVVAVGMGIVRAEPMHLYPTIFALAALLSASITYGTLASIPDCDRFDWGMALILFPIFFIPSAIVVAVFLIAAAIIL